MNRHPLLTTCFLALLLSISGCGPRQQPAPTTIPAILATATAWEATPVPEEALPTQPPLSAGKIPILYDDDGSPDGTAALLYLLSHPQVDLKAVSISYGEAHPEIYIQHIGRMLDHFGFVDIPLGYGQDSPLAGAEEFPEELRQAANDFWGLPIPNADKTYPAQTASELMVSIINQSPVPVTLFVTGPCTNLAQALRLDPDIKNNIAALYMMAGAVYVPGNITDFYPDHENKVAEWNLLSDPQAAYEVFEAGMNFYLVPLDATNQVLVSRQDIVEWRQGGEVADFAADIYDMLLNNWGVEEGAIWDLMTAAIMLKPDLCVFQPLHLQVVTQAGPTSGQTAVIPGEEANVSVCLEPDADLIRQTLIDVFSKSIDKPTPAVTSASLIFRVDFTGGVQPGWTWRNENPSRWAITPDGWLQIAGEDASLLADGTQSNLLCREAPDSDFQITVHLSADPTEDFQQATLYLYEDGNNYVAMNRGYCSPCETGGGGVFMEYKSSGNWGSYQVATQNTEILLRLVSQEHTITGYYAFEAGEWQRLGSVENYLELPTICLGVSNVDSDGTRGADLVGKFDFIEISRP